MASPFIGEIIMFGGNFAPRNWAQCNGQLIAVSQNTALFSILGTTYGGNGRTDFALPELRGRSPMHDGGSAGPGLQRARAGEKAGAETHTLTVQQLPSHKHTFKAKCDSNNGTTAAAANHFIAAHTTNAFSANSDSTMGAFESEGGGGGQGFSIMQPYLAINFIIALTGTYPSRN